MGAAMVLLYAWFWLPSVAAVVLLLARSFGGAAGRRNRTDEGRPEGCCTDLQGEK